MLDPGDLLRRFPWMLVLAALALAGWGYFAIARAEELADTPPRLAERHLVWAAVTLTAGCLAVAVSYRRLARGSLVAMGLVVGLLVAVYWTQPINGARRWFALGSASLQPSELAKLAYVWALAQYLMHRENHRRLPGLLVPLAATLVPVLLILRQPDLGTSLVFLPVMASMLWAAGARLRHLAIVAACGVLLAPVVWSQMSREQRSRITALAQQNLPEQLPTADGYHLHQAQTVRALGGTWGSLLSGQPIDDPLAYHLPAAATDFVFAVVGERWGLWGSLAVLLLEAMVVCGLLRVASATQEPLGRLAAVGTAALWATETWINTAMTVGLAPVTGLSLPLVSYGGSGLLAHGVALALVVNMALRPGYQLAGEPFRFAPWRTARARLPGRLARAGR